MSSTRHSPTHARQLKLREKTLQRAEVEMTQRQPVRVLLSASSSFLAVFPVLLMHVLLLASMFLENAVCTVTLVNAVHTNSTKLSLTSSTPRRPGEPKAWRARGREGLESPRP